MTPNHFDLEIKKKEVEEIKHSLNKFTCAR